MANRYCESCPEHPILLAQDLAQRVHNGTALQEARSCPSSICRASGPACLSHEHCRRGWTAGSYNRHYGCTACECSGRRRNTTLQCVGSRERRRESRRRLRRASPSGTEECAALVAVGLAGGLVPLRSELVASLAWWKRDR